MSRGTEFDFVCSISYIRFNQILRISVFTASSLCYICNIFLLLFSSCLFPRNSNVKFRLVSLVLPPFSIRDCYLFLHWCGVVVLWFYIRPCSISLCHFIHAYCCNLSFWFIIFEYGSYFIFVFYCILFLVSCLRSLFYCCSLVNYCLIIMSLENTMRNCRIWLNPFFSNVFWFLFYCFYFIFFIFVSSPCFVLTLMFVNFCSVLMALEIPMWSCLF